MQYKLHNLKPSPAHINDTNNYISEMIIIQCGQNFIGLPMQIAQHDQYHIFRKLKVRQGATKLLIVTAE